MPGAQVAEREALGSEVPYGLPLDWSQAFGMRAFIGRYFGWCVFIGAQGPGYQIFPQLWGGGGYCVVEVGNDGRFGGLVDDVCAAVTAYSSNCPFQRFRSSHTCPGTRNIAILIELPY